MYFTVDPIDHLKVAHFWSHGWRAEIEPYGGRWFGDLHWTEHRRLPDSVLNDLAFVKNLAAPRTQTHTLRSSALKIVIAITGEGTDTLCVCKIASPFQDMVNPQVNLFQ